MSRIIPVSCAIILKEGKVLVAQRSEKMALPLKWEFPGGKIESGESAEGCLMREILEELNITIQVIHAFPVNIHRFSKEKEIELIPFLCNYSGGELILKEHHQVLWLDVERLSELDWSAADIPIVKNFIEWFSLQNIHFIP
ncbi:MULTISPECIES: (deoxy)nucleoside triphosphate pyrophosphohydrolase [Rhodonellum]|nr:MULTISPECIES: (deoxy)nucleoside triphosphate pyrophosphohydrolase [Rhodonellum]MDO9554949.1 (deoxy)nucleoside triphosphate pyrophosphohydrolase [Rhodonellum sp.]SDZ47025.1 8-oxo-dGTP diphosphatase [Rhodonellum ikkaensis]